MRRYCGTVDLGLFDGGVYREWDPETWWPADVEYHEQVRYFIGKLEVGDDSGRLHWQFYIEFKQKVPTPLV